MNFKFRALAFALTTGLALSLSPAARAAFQYQVPVRGAAAAVTPIPSDASASPATTTINIGWSEPGWEASTGTLSAIGLTDYGYPWANVYKYMYASPGPVSFTITPPNGTWAAEEVLLSDSNGFSRIQCTPLPGLASPNPNEGNHRWLVGQVDGASVTYTCTFTAVAGDILSLNYYWMGNYALTGTPDNPGARIKIEFQ